MAPAGNGGSFRSPRRTGRTDMRRNVPKKMGSRDIGPQRPPESVPKASLPTAPEGRVAQAFEKTLEITLSGRVSRCRGKSGMYGGERGIRTLDTLSRIHAFQACAFNHSATSPQPHRGSADFICDADAPCKAGNRGVGRSPGGPTGGRGSSPTSRRRRGHAADPHRPSRIDAKNAAATVKGRSRHRQGLDRRRPRIAARSP